MNAIGIEGVAKAHGGRRALDGVTLSVAPAEIVVLVGPAGAGKSVLLRIVAGLEAPDDGTVRLGRRPIGHKRPSRRGIAMVPERPALLPRLARPVAMLRALTRRRDRSESHTALERALARRPRLLLLDDPWRDADPAWRRSARADLVGMLRRAGVAVLYATRDVEEALEVADRIAVMEGGRIVQCDRPARIRAAAPTLSMVPPAFHRVEVEPVVAGGVLSIRIGGMPVHLPRGFAAAAGRACTLAFPPAALGPAEGDDAIPRHRIDTGAPEGQGTPQRQGVAIDPDMMMLFDRASGRRLEPAHG